MPDRQEPVPWRQQARTYLRLVRTREPSDAPPKALVFAQGRTGSTLLVDLLRSVDGMHCDDEILWRHVAWPAGWLEAHRRRHIAEAYACKAKIYQLTDEQGIDDVASWLRGRVERGWRLIHLHRRNVLRHVLSNIAAEQRGSFVFRGETPPELAALTVEPAHLIHWMGVRTGVAAREREALTGLPHVSVCYEDDLIDADRQQETLDRLTRHLGLPAAVASTSVRRTVEGPLREVLANHDEVAAALAGTPWAVHLD